MSIIPYRKAEQLERIVPNLNELWGFGEYDDREGGLWATLIVLDGQPDVTFKTAENGDQLGMYL